MKFLTSQGRKLLTPLESQILRPRRDFGSQLYLSLICLQGNICLQSNQQDGVTWPGSHSKSVIELGLAPGLVGSTQCLFHFIRTSLSTDHVGTLLLENTQSKVGGMHNHLSRVRQKLHISGLKATERPQVITSPGSICCQVTPRSQHHQVSPLGVCFLLICILFFFPLT